MGKRAKNKDAETIQEQTIDIVISMYLFGMFALYPMLMQNGYNNIMDVKSSFFYWMSGIATGLAMLLMLSIQAGDCRRNIRNGFRQQDMELRITGICTAVLLVSVTIGLLLSPYKEEGFWGTNGRRFGYFALVITILLFYIVWKFWKYNRHMMAILHVSCAVGFFIAICNYFQLDVLGIYENGWQNSNYISTFGNKNSMGAFIAIVLSVEMVHYCMETEMRWRIGYGLLCVLGFGAMVASASDGTYLAIGAAFLVLLYLMLDDGKTMRRYLELAALFLAVNQGLGMWHEQLYPLDDMISGIPAIFAYQHQLLIFLLVPVVLWLTSLVMERRQQTEYAKGAVGIWGKRCYLILLCIGILAAMLLIGKVNGMDSRKEAVEAYGTLARYLYWDENWGHLRATDWMYAVDIFKQAPVLQKLFGYGQGNFYYAILQTCGSELNTDTGIMIDAHNEVLDFLINTGIVGLLSYLGIIFSTLVYFCRKKKDNSTYSLWLVLMAAYLAQGLVNNCHIYITPLFFLMLGMGLASGRTDGRQEA